MNTFTPGPWYAPADKSFYVHAGPGQFICNASGQANARLIAAAPEMLAALQTIVAGYQAHFDAMPVAWQTYDNIARAVIAQATGEE